MSPAPDSGEPSELRTKLAQLDVARSDINRHKNQLSQGAAKQTSSNRILQANQRMAVAAKNSTTRRLQTLESSAAKTKTGLKKAQHLHPRMNTNSHKLLLLESKVANALVDRGRMQEAMSGNMVLRHDLDNENVTAAALNAAAAGLHTDDYTVTLEALYGTVYGKHTWASFAPVITPAEAATDADIGAPTVKWTDDLAATPRFVKGAMRLTVIFDTDAGATKVYQAGDSVTVQIQVAADDELLGWPVTLLTKTYDVI